MLCGPLFSLACEPAEFAYQGPLDEKGGGYPLCERRLAQLGRDRTAQPHAKAIDRFARYIRRAPWFPFRFFHLTKHYSRISCASIAFYA